MELELSDQYYLKAAGNYKYDIDEALESLKYALSYDPEHAPAHCLSGKICGTYLMSYEKAFHHLELALIYDPYFPDTYYTYPFLLIQSSEFARADQVIKQGMEIKGVDKSSLLMLSGQSHEVKGNFYFAKASLKRARIMTNSCDRMHYIDTSIKRVNKKMKLLKTK